MGSEKQKCRISRISVASEIKPGRMEWAGHVERVNANCMQGLSGDA